MGCEPFYRPLQIDFLFPLHRPHKHNTGINYEEWTRQYVSKACVGTITGQWNFPPTARQTLCKARTRDKSILLLFFFLAILFFLPLMLKILIEVSLFCSKLSYIASCLTVTSYTYIPQLMDSYS